MTPFHVTAAARDNGGPYRPPLCHVTRRDGAFDMSRGPVTQGNRGFPPNVTQAVTQAVTQQKIRVTKLVTQENRAFLDFEISPAAGRAALPRGQFERLFAGHADPLPEPV